MSITEKPPVQAEAEGVPTIPVTWRGETYAVPSDPDDWPVTAQLAFEENRIAAGIRALLPTEQWEQIMATRPVNRDMKDLAAAMTAALGFGSPGE